MTFTNGLSPEAYESSLRDLAKLRERHDHDEQFKLFMRSIVMGSNATEIMEGIPANDIDTQIEIARASGALSTSKKLQPDGNWTLIVVYPGAVMDVNEHKD